MRTISFIASALIVGLMLGGTGITIAHVVKVDSADDTALVKRHQEIVAFRNAWMADCLQHAPPFQCVYMWSSIRPEEFVQ